jgi:hypothetical protein
MRAETNVASFIVRFVQETAPDDVNDSPDANWRGSIKHIQTNSEQRFTRFAEAVAFIANYVSLDESPEQGSLSRCKAKRDETLSEAKELPQQRDLATGGQ